MATSSNSDVDVEQLLQERAALQKEVETLEADRKAREQLRIKEIEVQSSSFAKDFKESLQREEAVTRKEEALADTKASLEKDFQTLKDKEKEVEETLAACNARQQQLCEELKEFKTAREQFLNDRAAIVDHAKAVQEKLKEMIDESDRQAAEIKELRGKLGDNQKNEEIRIEMQELQEKMTAEKEELRTKMKDAQDKLEAEKEEVCTKMKEAQDKLETENKALRAKLKEHELAAELRTQFPVREFHTIFRAIRSKDQVQLTEAEQVLVEEGSSWASSLKDHHGGNATGSQHSFAKKIGAVVKADVDKLSEMYKTAEKAIETSQPQSIRIQHVLDKAADALLKFEGIRTSSALAESGSAELSELAFTVSRLCDLFKQPKCSKQISGLSASNSSLLRASAAVCLAGSGAYKRAKDSLNSRYADVKTCSQKLKLLHCTLKKHAARINKLLQRDGETTNISDEMLQMLEIAANDKDGGLLVKLVDIARRSMDAWHLLEEYQQCTRRFAKSLGMSGSAEDSSKAPTILFSWLLTDMKGAMAAGSITQSPWVEFAVLLRQAAKVASTKRPAAAGSDTPSKRMKATPEQAAT
eukprot:TRINITY_DN7499_c0_g1_i3.p1 TRINITY_DN7499_c0_g1~~TRINITY_DN7499_c0_g1_i3.p1  ORF type:complete len:585 (-),score=166.11 TRINITY_DN7499_c0_g1_i3:153-1907(-)